MKWMRRNTSDTMTSLTKNERGSSSIFLVIILASMIVTVFAMVAASLRVATVSYSDGVLNLSARSVMSEFHGGLKDDYGIFAFPGSVGDIEGKLIYYAGYTFHNNERTELENIKVDVTNNSLINVDVFEEEIIDYVKFATARNLIEESLPPEEKGEGVAVSGTGSTDRSYEIKNEEIIKGLPSYELGEDDTLWAKVKSLAGDGSGVLKGTGKKFLVNAYIMDKFKNAQNRSKELNTFFENEAEYILEGEASDAKNYRKFRDELLLLRNAINLAYIYTDPKKRAELTTVAALVATPPVSLAVEFALAEIWALAEAENDVKLLEHGEKVPVLKSEATWALTAKNVLVKEKTDYISMKNRHGFTYQGYLQMFLLFSDRAIKLTRMMDLIQINMKGNYNSDFLMKEMNRGFLYEAEVNGRKYKYEERY